MYTVLEQPNKDIPVYIVKKEDGLGPTRKLHRNHLLPIKSFPLDTPLPKNAVQSKTMSQSTRPPVTGNESKSRTENQDSTSSDDESSDNEFIVPIVDRTADHNGDLNNGFVVHNDDNDENVDEPDIVDGSTFGSGEGRGSISDEAESDSDEAKMDDKPDSDEDNVNDKV